MVATDTGPERQSLDPIFETCPLCAFEGPRIAVYRHIDADHRAVEPDDFFSDPIGTVD